jgi:hypothetical protein
VVLTEVTVCIAIGGNGKADAGGGEAVGLPRGILGNDGECDFAVMEIFQALFAGNKLAIGWKYG